MVFSNRVLRRIFGPKRDEVTGELRKLHNEELHNLYSSSSTIRQIKSGTMGWAVHVAHMGQESTGFCWESPKERDHSEDQGIDRRMESEWIFRSLAVEVQSGSSWLRIGAGGRLL
jgi:hypothetical protein